ncbi:MAG: DUF4282 domain-containing protein [Candidatus Mcinerneyibacterium aminivorans]|uniref:DUF4282 domain-containing protein n=1 Tax=Candidatus Mcinerneyibacterium aminivorans TaxID=2703815 RepID=A0A5D0M9L3_9BACT|nr:MAG: DUF4282 domain-containing protein [Candidatus Mcinerneyibacterium aminivorans]
MESKSFIKNLFDFDFSEFVTPKIIKALYILCMVGIAIGALMIIVNGFNISTLFGILSLLIFAPLYVVIGLLIIRVWLELVIVFFKIHDYVKDLKDKE